MFSFIIVVRLKRIKLSCIHSTQGYKEASAEKMTHAQKTGFKAQMEDLKRKQQKAELAGSNEQFELMVNADQGVRERESDIYTFYLYLSVDFNI